MNFNNRYPIDNNAYRLRPVTSFVASVALTAAANLGLNHMPLDEHHTVEVAPRAALTPGSAAETNTVVQQAYTETFGPYTMPYAQHFAESPAATLVNPDDVADIAQRVTQAQENGEQDVHIEVIGMSSDEAGSLPGYADPQHGLGETNDRNQTLAAVRGQSVAEQLQKSFAKQHVDVEMWVMNGEESVLPTPRIAELRKLAGRHTLSLDGMITAYNANRNLPQAITTELDASLASQRGARVEIHGSRPVYVPSAALRQFNAPKAEPQEPPKPFQQTPDNFIVVPVPIATRRKPEEEADFGSAISQIFERIDDPEKEEALV